MFLAAFLTVAGFVLRIPLPRGWRRGGASDA
jgi:hypothetical protein